MKAEGRNERVLREGICTGFPRHTAERHLIRYILSAPIPTPQVWHETAKNHQTTMAYKDRKNMATTDQTSLTSHTHARTTLNDCVPGHLGTSLELRHIPKKQRSMMKRQKHQVYMFFFTINAKWQLSQKLSSTKQLYFWHP